MKNLRQINLSKSSTIYAGTNLLQSEKVEIADAKNRPKLSKNFSKRDP